MFSTQQEWYLCATAATGQPPAVICIDNAPYVIGRRAGVDLKLESPFVSGRHAELTFQGNRCFVTDLGSRNGVYVNGARVRRGQLGVGDLLRIGDTQFRILRKHRSAGRPGLASKRVDLAGEQRRWLSGQLDRLLREKSVHVELTAIHSLQDETVVGYRGTACSNLSGLETEAKMIQVARQFGRDAELDPVLKACVSSVVRRLGAGRWLCIETPPAINVELELLPYLQLLREDHPDTLIVVAMADLPARSLRTLQHLSAVLRELSVDLEWSDFQLNQLAVVQASQLNPAFVRVDARAELVQNGSELRIRSLADRLHHNGICMAVGHVGTETQFNICRDAGVDVADGSYFGDPLPLPSLPLPDTSILTASQIAEFLPPASTADSASLDETRVFGLPTVSRS